MKFVKATNDTAKNEAKAQIKNSDSPLSMRLVAKEIIDNEHAFSITENTITIEDHATIEFCGNVVKYTVNGKSFESVNNGVAMREAMDKVFDMLKTGTWIATGYTCPVKDQLKAAGMIWNPYANRWESETKPEPIYGVKFVQL